MKTLADKSKNKYKYFCDRCNKEISFKNNTLHQLSDKYSEKHSRKAYDLCDKCMRLLDKRHKKV